MVITIPEDFSANAATLTREKPEKMELSYETNPGTNYIASKMSETAMEKIQSSVRKKLPAPMQKRFLNRSVRPGTEWRSGRWFREAPGGNPGTCLRK